LDLRRHHAHAPVALRGDRDLRHRGAQTLCKQGNSDINEQTKMVWSTAATMDKRGAAAQSQSRRRTLEVGELVDLLAELRLGGHAEGQHRVDVAAEATLPATSANSPWSAAHDNTAAAQDARRSDCDE
jgi:hypothetical protein